MPHQESGAACHIPHRESRARHVLISPRLFACHTASKIPRASRSDSHRGMLTTKADAVKITARRSEASPHRVDGLSAVGLTMAVPSFPDLAGSWKTKNGGGMNMSMPGFSAEASIDVTSGRYAEAATRGAALTQVTPQLQGTFGSLCTRVCRCCSASGNRFCCSHCRFCSGPISSGLELSL